MMDAARCSTLVVTLLLIPSPSLAVRGSDEPHETKLRKTCSEVLRSEIAKGRIKNADPLRLHFTSGEEFRGRFVAVDGDSVIRVVDTNNPAQEITNHSLDEISSVGVRRYRLRPLWMIGGLVVGGAIGGLARDSGCDEPTRIGECALAPTARVAAGSAVGLFFGTFLSLLVPKDVTLDCQ